MSASFEAILISRSFRFIIGVNETPFVVHESAVANQSPALATLMRGSMSESQAGEAKWMDVDERTFLRFAEFAYTGDYSIPTVVVTTNTPKLTPDKPEEIDLVWPEPLVPVTRKGKKKCQRPAFNTFESLGNSLVKPRPNFKDACTATIREGADENVGEVLLIHASLYILAEKWGVDSLKKLTLFKLHTTLGILQLDPPRARAIVDLARYAYSDENIPDLDNGLDGLRELICEYILSRVEVVSKQATFLDLMEEGGPFVRDLWRATVPRVSLQ